jgi:hypothetical protein
MLKRTPLGLAILSLLVACALDSPAGDRRYAGVYVWGHEVHTFRPCGQEETYWVSASTWVIGELLDHYVSESSELYQPLYLEFRGQILDEQIGGFAAAYSGLIRISEIVDWTTSVPSGCGVQ